MAYAALLALSVLGWSNVGSIQGDSSCVQSMGPAPERIPATATLALGGHQNKMHTGTHAPDAVTMILPEDSSLPTEALVFSMAIEPCLIAKKTLGSWPQ